MMCSALSRSTTRSKFPITVKAFQTNTSRRKIRTFCSLSTATSVTNEGGRPAKEMIENDLVKKTKAFNNGKIVYLDPEVWYQSGGGLVSVGEMVKEAAQAVQ